MYYCGFTYRETYALPVAYKQWFIKRLVKELTRKNDDGDSPPARNAPAEQRALMGMSRPEAPSRLKRFS